MPNRVAGGVSTPEDTAAEGIEGRFGSSSRKRILKLYGLIAIGIVIVNFALRAGSGMTAPKGDGGEAAQAEGGHGAVDVHAIFWKLLLAIAVIILVSRLCGALFSRINQPQVMGEIVGGILLGPSLLGAVAPQVSEFLFADQVMPFIDVLAQVGLVLFMFLIGVELDVRLIKGHGEAAAVVSHASIVGPFVTGVLLALGIFTTLGSEEGRFLPFALFLGASMSITAFPVLARILAERGLHKTRLGTVTITCAAVDDVTAWCMLAVVIAVAAATGIGGAFVTIALAIAFVAFMIAVVRPLLARIAKYHDENGELGGTILALIFVGLLLSALATDRIGIHAIFGAFLFGAIMPQHSKFIHELTLKLEDFSVIFLLPLFFAYSGLRTEIGQLGTDLRLWGFAVLIIAVAIIGKWGGSTLAARYVGLTWRESLAVGILMNCRGLTELVILNIGLDLGVIPPALFAMLVLMALVTTFMTTPILSRIYSPEQQARMVAEESGEELTEEVWRVLVHVPNLERAHELVHTALSLAGGQGERVEVVLMRTVQLGEGVYLGTDATTALDSLKPLVDFVEGAGYTAVPLAVPTRSLDETIVRVAMERKPNLILLPWRRPFFGSRFLAGSIGNVLREAEADVAVLIDPAGAGLDLTRDEEVLVPYGSGFHEEVALDLALRIAKDHSTSVRLLGGVAGDAATSDADADGAHLLASVAAEAYKRSGVWTTAATEGNDMVGAAIEGAKRAGLVVLGVSDEWAHEKHSLGRVREAVAARSTTPILLVRRHAQPKRRWIGRGKEWMTTTGEIDLRRLEDIAEAGDVETAAEEALRKSW